MTACTCGCIHWLHAAFSRKLIEAMICFKRTAGHVVLVIPFNNRPIVVCSFSYAIALAVPDVQARLNLGVPHVAVEIPDEASGGSNSCSGGHRYDIHLARIHGVSRHCTSIFGHSHWSIPELAYQK